MNIPASRAHYEAMVALAATVDDRQPVDQRATRLDFDAIYDVWFHEVVRWIGALSGLTADADDVAQDVFLVVRRKLPGFDGGNLRGWLYAITARSVSDWRRRAWFRHVWRGSSELPLERLPALDGDPARALDQAEARRLLRQLLDRLSPKLRTVFILFEIEGYSGEEIAALQGVPPATVRTRLHRARREFVRLARRAQGEER